MSKKPKGLSEDEISERNHAAYVEGADYFEAGQFNKAKAAFEEAIQCWPEDSEAWMALGNCYNELKRPEKAEEHFRKALEVCANAEAPKILFNLGNSLYDQKRFREAIEAYTLVPKGHEMWPKTRANLERARKKQENLNERTGG